MLTSDENTGDNFIILPEKIYLASIFIGCAAIIDFLDGFVARWLKATSNLGKQLDSLADVVSFGVAPAMIVYEFLRISFAQQSNGLDVNIAWLLPAFIIPCAGAYRLARFNVDEEQRNGFKGVPIPAVGLLIAAFPLIYWYSTIPWILTTITNEWFWYAIIITVSFLMISALPMMALKFKNSSLKTLFPFIILAVIVTVSAFIFQWLAVPVSFVAYVVLSLFFKEKNYDL